MKAPGSFGVWIVGVLGFGGRDIGIFILRLSPELLLFPPNLDEINTAYLCCLTLSGASYCIIKFNKSVHGTFNAGISHPLLEGRLAKIRRK